MYLVNDSGGKDRFLLTEEEKLIAFIGVVALCLSNRMVMARWRSGDWLTKNSMAWRGVALLGDEWCGAVDVGVCMYVYKVADLVREGKGKFICDRVEVCVCIYARRFVVDRRWGLYARPVRAEEWMLV